MATKTDGASILDLQVSVLSEMLHTIKTKNDITRGKVAWQVLSYLNQAPEFWLQRRHWTVNQWLTMALNDHYEREGDEFRQHEEPPGGFTLCGGQHGRSGKQVQS